jgi:hypothetical protein
LQSELFTDDAPEWVGLRAHLYFQYRSGAIIRRKKSQAGCMAWDFAFD